MTRKDRVMDDETQITDIEESQRLRSKAAVIPEAKAYFKRYGIMYMNALNATGTAAWWLHSWLESKPHWTWFLVIPAGAAVAGYLLNKLQWLSTIASLRTYKPLGGLATITMNWVMAVIWLPLSFAQYLTTVHYPRNFFWYMAAVAIITSMAAGRLDKVLAKR